MERAKNLIVLLIQIFIAIAVILFITVYIWTSSTEETYQKVLEDIKAGNFEVASEQIKSIPHYKDSNDIAVYIYPISLFYNKYNSAEQQLNGYKMSLAAIAEVLPKLKNKTYIKDLNELTMVLNFKIEEFQAKGSNDSRSVLLSEIVDMLKIGDVAEARPKLEKLNGKTDLIVKEELLAYIDFIDAENLNDETALMESIKRLNPKYKGIMSQEIQSAVLKYVDSIKWNELYISKENSDSIAVEVGMSKAQVLALMAGKTTTRENRVKNRYGNFELIQFDNNRIFYFENEVLTAFTDKV